MEQIPPISRRDVFSRQTLQDVADGINSQSILTPPAEFDLHGSPVGQQLVDRRPVIIRDRRIGRIVGSDVTYRPILVGCQYWVQCLYIKPLSPSPIASLTRSGTTGTLVNVAHGYIVGDVFEIQGADQDLWNLRFVVKTVVDADTVTFTVNTLPASPATTTGVITATFIPPADIATEDSDFPETGISNDNTAGSIVLATNLDELADNTHMLAEDSSVKVEVFAMYDHSNPQRPRWFFSRAIVASPAASDCCGGCQGCSGGCTTLAGLSTLPHADGFPSYYAWFLYVTTFRGTPTTPGDPIQMTLDIEATQIWAKIGDPSGNYTARTNYVALCHLAKFDTVDAYGPEADTGLSHTPEGTVVEIANYYCEQSLGTLGIPYSLWLDDAATIPYNGRRGLKMVFFQSDLRLAKSPKQSTRGFDILVCFDDDQPGEVQLGTTLTGVLQVPLKIHNAAGQIVSLCEGASGSVTTRPQCQVLFGGLPTNNTVRPDDGFDDTEPVDTPAADPDWIRQCNRA